MQLKLNTDQKAAAESEEHCLVIAPPGSGKTGMLSTKAAIRLKKKQTVAAVTFTRDAALELRHRILQLAGEEAKSRLMVGTYHSIDMLMAFPKSMRSGMGSAILDNMVSPFTAKWKIVSNGSRMNYLLHAINSSGLDMDIQDASELVEKLKSGQLNIKLQPESVQILFKEYLHALKKSGEIDFQDILLNTNEAMRKGQLKPLPVDYLLLDEFQDTDPIQLEWAMMHRHQSRITAVGDDDQSIYGFRNAMGIDGMNEFIRLCKPVEIRLANNYRSKPEILYYATKLIAKNDYFAEGTNYNSGRKDKEIFPNHSKGALVMWEYLASIEEEAECVCEYVQKAREHGQTIAIIARTNRLLETIEGYLLRAKIPYELEKGSILKTAEFEVFRSLMLQATKPSVASFRHVLMWAKVKTEDIDAILKTLGHDFSKINATAAKKSLIDEKALAVLRVLKDKIPKWSDAIKSNYYGIVRQGIVQFLEVYLEEGHTIKRLLACAKVYDPEKTELPLLDHIAWVESLLKPTDKASKTEADPLKCKLMSAHGSKGLEFDNVWIIGANKDVFPNNKDSSILAEERRLFYVAMTRAKKHLIITATGSEGYSQFLDEACIPRSLDRDEFWFKALLGPPN